MAINDVISVSVNDPMFSYLTDLISNADDDKLTIIARSEKNRKDKKIPPLSVINDIYFYVAYELDGATAFIGAPTNAQIIRARENFERKVVLTTTSETNSLSTIDDFRMNSLSTIDDFRDTDSSMIIATTADNTNGASILYFPDILLRIKSKIGRYRILPSSIHEIILVPEKTGIKANVLDGLVKQVNRYTVTENEYLADRSFALEEWI